MSDFLTRLVERSLGVGEVVRPRLGSLFEPRAAAAARPIVEEALEVDAKRAAPAPAEPKRESEPRSSFPSPPEHEPKHEPVGPLQQSVTRPSRGREAAEVPRFERTLEVERRRETRSQTGFAASQEEVPPWPTPLPGVEPEPRPTLQQSVTRSDRESARPPETVVVREHIPGRTEHAPGRLEPHESWLEPPPQTGRRPVAAERAPTAVEPPVVRVTIGRVDVRAVLPPAAPERAAPKRRPRMTLDEYLRDGGHR